MKKVLMLAVGLLLVGSLFMSCSKDKDNNPGPSGPTEQVTIIPNIPAQDAIPPEQKTAITNASDLSGGVGGHTYTISELRFASNFVSAGDSPLFEINNNINYKNLVIALKDESNKYEYFSISGNQITGFTTTPTNNAITVDTANNGFKVSNAFYSDAGEITVAITINFKGLSETFTFKLKSNASRSGIPANLIGTWESGITDDMQLQFFTISAEGFTLNGITYSYTYNSNSKTLIINSVGTLSNIEFVGSDNFRCIDDNNGHQTGFYRQGSGTTGIQGDWRVYWDDNREFRLIISGNNFTFYGDQGTADSPTTQGGTFTDDGSFITFSQPIHFFPTARVGYAKVGNNFLVLGTDGDNVNHRLKMRKW